MVTSTRSTDAHRVGLASLLQQGAHTLGRLASFACAPPLLSYGGEEVMLLAEVNRISSQAPQAKRWESSKAAGEQCSTEVPSQPYIHETWQHWTDEATASSPCLDNLFSTQPTKHVKLAADPTLPAGTLLILRPMACPADPVEDAAHAQELTEEELAGMDYGNDDSVPLTEEELACMDYGNDDSVPLTEEELACMDYGNDDSVPLTEEEAACMEYDDEYAPLTEEEAACIAGPHIDDG
jgi:hypothetical protein